MLTIYGEYSQQIFFAEDTNYCIIRVTLLADVPDYDFFAGDSITITGNFPNMALQHEYQFDGEMIEHVKYGYQFRAVSVQEILPKTRTNVIRYLEQLKVKGVGTKTLEQLFDFFGENLLQTLAQADMTVFDGFSATRWNDEKALALLSAIKQNQSAQSNYLELIKFGFPQQMIIQLQEVYGEDLLTAIHTNCYQLLSDFDGIKIKTIDQIVQNFFPEQLTYRIQYAIIYHVKSWCYQTGSTIVTQKQIYELVNSDINFQYEPNNILTHIELLLMEKKLYAIQEYYALDYFYHTEKSISFKLLDLLVLDKKDYIPLQIEKYITLCEENFGIQYDDQQHEAIKTAFTESVFLLTGGPGTGKTTIIRAILEVYMLSQISEGIDEQQLDQKIAMLAPTGRAAQRMQDATRYPAKTIHSFLGWDLQQKTYRFNEQNPLANIEFIIVDEASMIDMWLLVALLQAIPNLKQIIFVGDADQLPSVSNGQCFVDIMQSKRFVTISLQKIFRQKAQSTIIDVANSINHGEHTDLYFRQSADYSFLTIQPSQLLKALEKVCLNAVQKGFELKNFQVLAPMYKGIVGIDAINEHLQSVLNPNVYEKDEVYIVSDTVRFLPNDKVIQLKNLPDLDVYNGDIGIIMSIEQLDNRTTEIVIDFSGNLVIFGREEMKQIKHAYCISIHKAQGSEFPLVIMPIFFQYSIMLYRQLIYTGASRARKALVILGQRPALLQAIDNNKKNERQTCLRSLLQDKADRAIISITEALSQSVIAEELGGVTPWDFL